MVQFNCPLAISFDVREWGGGGGGGSLPIQLFDK